MKIVVLHGSPKGEESVTFQYVRYLEARFPDVEFSIHLVGKKAAWLEKNRDAAHEIFREIKKADAILWSFPLYYLLVPSQYKRFIEMAMTQPTAFKGKFAMALSTSIHFFDHTAHRYIEEISEDLGMNYAGSFSADMKDLLSRQGRKQLEIFFQDVLTQIESGASLPRRSPRLSWKGSDYRGGRVQNSTKSQEKNVLIITDTMKGSIGAMVEHCAASFEPKAEIQNLEDLKILGGCNGCMECGYDNSCTYGDKDEFTNFYREKAMKAHILILAGTVTDRYLSWKWKQFFDRSFFMNHTPSIQGAQVGFLVSGPASQMVNLQEILHSWVTFQNSHFLGIISDETETAKELSRHIEELAARAVRLSEMQYIPPQTFPSYAGAKLFRDDVYSRLRMVFQADHRHYRHSGMYDFPQKQWKLRMVNAIIPILLLIPKIRQQFYSKMNYYMVQPYKKLVNKISGKEDTL